MQKWTTTRYATGIVISMLLLESCGTGVSTQNSGTEYQGVKNLAVHILRSITDQGRRVTLEDGSVWLISHFSRTAVAAWQPGHRVTVGERGRMSRFEYYLSVMRNGSVASPVDADFVGYEQLNTDTTVTQLRE